MHVHFPFHSTSKAGGYLTFSNPMGVFQLLPMTFDGTLSRTSSEMSAGWGAEQASVQDVEQGSGGIGESWER